MLRVIGGERGLISEQSTFSSITGCLRVLASQVQPTLANRAQGSWGCIQGRFRRDSFPLRLLRGISFRLKADAESSLVYIQSQDDTGRIVFLVLIHIISMDCFRRIYSFIFQ